MQTASKGNRAGVTVKKQDTRTEFRKPRLSQARMRLMTGTGIVMRGGGIGQNERHRTLVLR